MAYCTNQRLAPGKPTRHGGATSTIRGSKQGGSKSATRRARRDALHKGHAAGPQPTRPAGTPLPTPNVVHVRNTSGQQRGTWATFAKASRQHARISQAELARRLGVDRTTVYRWESGSNRPENAELIQAFAAACGIDPEEAFAAAGLRPGAPAPEKPTVEVDEEIELVRTDPRLTEAMKRRIIGIILERRARDKAAGIEDTRRMIELARGQ